MKISHRIVRDAPHQLNERIARARKLHEKTGQQLANECGITYQAWRNIETGRQGTIKLSLLRKMEKALDIESGFELSSEDLKVSCS